LRAVAMADLWNTGALDVVVANERGPLLIYKNTVTAENKWIEFALEGTASNRSAIGWELRAKTRRLELTQVGSGAVGTWPRMHHKERRGTEETERDCGDRRHGYFNAARVQHRPGARRSVEREGASHEMPFELDKPVGVEIKPKRGRKNIARPDRTR